MRNIRLFSFILAAFLCVAIAGIASAAPSLEADKPEYKADDTITLSFEGIKSPASQDWISLYRTGTPNEKYGQWYYLGGRSEGTLTFTAPGDAGDYEFRLFLNWPDGGYVSVAKSDIITVKGLKRKPGGKSTLSLDADIYDPGETIEVMFTAPSHYARDAWVGIMPSSVPHGSEEVCDQYDMAYQYIERKTSGTMRFMAPSGPGKYDMRMFDTDNGGMEVTYASFEVKAADPGSDASLELDAEIYEPGVEVVVEFTAPAHFARDAWVGIIPSSVPHGSEAQNDQYDLSYRYLEGRTSGTLIFTAPPTPGEYDMRMHDTDNNGSEVTYESFEVER